MEDKLFAQRMLMLCLLVCVLVLGIKTLHQREDLHFLRADQIATQKQISELRAERMDLRQIAKNVGVKSPDDALTEMRAKRAADYAAKKVREEAKHQAAIDNSM